MSGEQTLIVADSAVAAETFDPPREFSEGNHIVCQQIFDPLLRFRPDCGFEPALAVSWERIDPLRVRFHLRAGVKFHNGEEFDANSVKFSVQRYLSTSTASPGLGYIDSIVRAEVVDSHTVDIVTKYPDRLLLNRLAGYVLMLPPRYIEQHGSEYFAAHPAGTGAFKLASWEKGKKIALTANKAYWQAGYPKLDNLSFVKIASSNTLDALFSGEAGLVTNLPGTQTRAVAQHAGTKVIKKPSHKILAAFFNVSSGPFSDALVRRAVNYAVNKAEIARYDTLGNGEPVVSFSVPGEAGHNADLMPRPFDPSKARELLNKAGYAHGFTFTALVNRRTERAAKILAAQLAAVGIKMEYTVIPDSLAVRELKARHYDMSLSLVYSFMCHSYFSQMLAFSSKSPFTLGTDIKLDAKFDELVAAYDGGACDRVARDIDAYVFNNDYGIFIYREVDVIGAARGLVFTPYSNGMTYYFATHYE